MAELAAHGAAARACGLAGPGVAGPGAVVMVHVQGRTSKTVAVVQQSTWQQLGCGAK